ncbi:conserved hypothetical protein [Candidatus Accumulibacter aalborgensis]|uniref:Uncharacterized protein n=1 Tax=Candidatus Accumulibacter aalborgensis TaxID=1860102 RepID=A0A1A8XJX6_9PROT|nr:hypothetical protein [Candidatus Accumulibacter aalborgensis]SBT05484.1 conserved hypothetical protein [Candidatus Accumulibacter aalborgensis]
MADNQDLVRRANSLIKPTLDLASGDRPEGRRRMRQRRSFVALAAVTDTANGQRLARPDGDDDDVPVLTDVVLAAPAAAEEGEERIAARLRAALAAELADAVDRQIANQLPALVEAALGKAADQVRQGMAATIEMALLDFQAQRGQLRLPLPEPDSDGPGHA